MKFHYVTNISDLYTFDKETRALLKFFEISTETYFVSLFSLSERNITMSLLMIHLKFTVVHYSNLNSSSINKPYLRAVEYTISCFFNFLFMFIWTRLLSKTLKKLSFFNADFQNSFQDVVYYRTLWCRTLWY